MRILIWVCRIVGLVQIILGLLYLFAPAAFLAWQGIAVPTADMNYPLAMFAARLLVYGAGMFVIARDPARHSFWIDGMIAIQLIDLAAGFFYTANGAVGLEVSGFPMFNATLIIVLLGWLRRHASSAHAA